MQVNYSEKQKIFVVVLTFLEKSANKENVSLVPNQEIKMTTAQSNPFDDLNGLVEALAKAPQDKEGAFRVSTWLMVLKKIQALQEAIGNTAEVIAKNEDLRKKTSSPSLQDITNQVKKELESDLAKSNATKIIF